ncbi:MAG TPA: hypothetical protein VFN21_09085, partial [Acidimicrobiales bacterium]|nr:hypothetical protein [Acidimicrobiales bacterium]
TGNTYVVEWQGQDLVKIDSGGAKTVIAGGFSAPTCAAVDEAGNVYLCDEGDNLVIRVAPDGTKTNLGIGLDQPGGVALA